MLQTNAFEIHFSLRKFVPLILLLVSASCFAHHAGTAFDMTRSETITGTVREFQFVNPHTWLTLAVKEEDGSVKEYRFEGQSVSVLARSGWSRNSLQPGDEITVNFAPYVDERLGGEFRDVILADGTVLGWQRI